MGRVERQLPARRSTELERTRSAALRAEARTLRDRTRALRGRAELLADVLVESLLKTEDGSADAPERFSFRAGRLRSSVALVRKRLLHWLERGGVDPATAADITLACSEACANAVEHPVRPARHAFEVEATRTADEIELTVRDFGGWHSAEQDDMRGRGLGMIRELMDDTEIVSGRHETTIVMRRARRASA
jgi:anti-sigma regulatory factor (Ser/Thr protein kinase)